MISITEKEFTQLSRMIEKSFGIYLKSEKKSLVMSRLQNILQEKGFKSYSQYYQYLINDKTGAAKVELVNRMTTTTFFPEGKEHLIIFPAPCCPDLKRNAKGGTQESGARMFHRRGTLYSGDGDKGLSQRGRAELQNTCDRYLKKP